MTPVASKQGRKTLAARLMFLPFAGISRPWAYRVLYRLLKDEEIRNWVIHTLSNQMAMTEATFAGRIPPDLQRIEGFQDCTWLYSSNELNHGLSRLRLDEAAYLYHLVCSYELPQVAELGRYKGGSTFLMAAAGATVLAMDNDRIGGQRELVPDLEAALARFGLLDRVEIVDADATTYAVAPESYDIVFFDCMYTYDLCRTIFDRWWPAVRPGGVFLFRDGKDSLLTEAVRYVSGLDATALGAESDPMAPGAFVAFRKR